MKKYMVEYTASVTGSMAGRDDGQPYRTTKQGTDLITMLQFFRKVFNEGGKRYGWKPPAFFEMDVLELDTKWCLGELKEFEKHKDDGADI